MNRYVRSGLIALPVGVVAGIVSATMISTESDNREAIKKLPPGRHAELQLHGVLAILGVPIASGFVVGCLTCRTFDGFAGGFAAAIVGMCLQSAIALTSDPRHVIVTNLFEVASYSVAGTVGGLIGGFLKSAVEARFED